MSTELPTFTTRAFKDERIKRDREAAKKRIALNEMGTFLIRARAQSIAVMYLMRRPPAPLLVVHLGRNHARRGTLIDFLRGLL